MLEIQGDHIIIIIIIGGMFSRIISGTLCLLIDITSLSHQPVGQLEQLPLVRGQGELCHLYRLPAGHPPPPPALHPRLVRGPTAMEVSNHHHDCSHGRAHLPHGPSGAAGCGRRLFLPLHLHKRESTVGRCDEVFVLHWNWPVSVPPPGLPGPVPGIHMRQSAGIWLRNVSIGCAWLLCLSSCVVDLAIIRYYPFPILFSSVFVSSGTLCVLFAVSRSGPMRESGAKRRALHTVAAITATLTLRFLTSLLPTILLVTLHLSLSQQCLLVMSSLTFSLPCSLVMPLLFLQRAGKLSNCQHTSRCGE